MGTAAVGGSGVRVGESGVAVGGTAVAEGLPKSAAVVLGPTTPLAARHRAREVNVSMRYRLLAPVGAPDESESLRCRFQEGACAVPSML